MEKIGVSIGMKKFKFSTNGRLPSDEDLEELQAKADDLKKNKKKAAKKTPKPEEE